MPHPAVGSQTVNIHGGTGGNGGTGGVSGGGGGAGEGPRTTLKYIKTESFTINNSLSTIEQPRSHFCRVNLGDLNLLDEIDQENVVEQHPIYRRRTGAFTRNIRVVVGTRRVHRARIFGHQDPMTVVVYNDSNFEQIKAQVLEAQRLRHPFLAQLFGFTCLAGLNALIYHDDMMTISQIQTMHSQSTLASTYIHYEMRLHFEAAQLYWHENTGTDGYDLPGTAWIRLSTGKLCLDIGDGVTRCIEILSHLRWNTTVDVPAEPLSLKLTENELHTKLLHALELDKFHAMLGYPGQWHSHNLPSSTESITLPSIGILRDCVDSNLGQLLTIPFTTSPFTKHLPPNGISMKSWNGYPLCGEVMPTGWTRVEYLNNEESSFWMTVHLDPYYETAVMKWWISQQSYVRKHLQRAIGLEEDYLPLYLITHISIICDLETRLDGFTLQGTFMADAHSNKVYLFLAPPQVEILNGHFTVAVPPETERYYWAFDPDGVDRLTHAVAEDIGLPKPRFSFDCGGMNWDERTDEQIREFHAAKGFDPDSRDATIALGYPLVDIEAMKRSAQELTGQRFMTVPDPNQVENEIYYSLGLC